MSHLFTVEVTTTTFHTFEDVLANTPEEAESIVEGLIEDGDKGSKHEVHIEACEAILSEEVDA